jgi:hypothetical protein
MTGCTRQNQLKVSGAAGRKSHANHRDKGWAHVVASKQGGD